MTTTTATSAQTANTVCQTKSQLIQLIGAGTPRETAARGLAYLLFVYTEDAVVFILVVAARDGLAILAIAITADPG